MTQSPEPAKLWGGLSLAGVVVGTLLAFASVMPSLLPRSAFLQGALAALNFAVGYAIATGIAHFTPWRPAKHRWVRWALLVGIVLGTVLLASAAIGWQNEVRHTVGLAPLDGLNWLAFLAGFVPLTALLLLAGRGIALLMRRSRARWGVRLGTGIGLGSTVLMVVALLAGAGIALDRTYLSLNGEPTASQPTSSLRSGGPGSAVAWDSVGRFGSTFLAGGPSASAITEVINQPALEPIRVYAGLQSAPDTAARAQLVVDELERTGAFDRSVLVVATATGSGWLEPQTVDAIEYLHAGDTAIAAMQYAYTPSWVSFLFDQQAAITAGQALFDAVYAKWSTLPADHRPQLLSYGLSLGALGSQGAFGSLDELRTQTGGAMFVGTPYNAQLWQTLTAERDAGSPVWLPVLDEGAEVRWYSTPQTAQQLPADWQWPRVLYLQHANDPVTWLNASLIWSAPEWLTGPRSPQVSQAMHWLPLLTAEALVIDMFMGEQMPAGTGHNYGDVVLSGWQAVSPGVLDAAAFAKVQAIIESYHPVQSVLND